MIRPLTSLRFIFALMVFSHHLGFVLSGDNENLKWIYNNVFAEGFIGVNFFFILSGFVLAYNYQERFEKKITTLKKFFVARFARIYPLHLLTLLLAFPLMLKKLWTGNKIFWGIKLITNLTLTQSFIPVKPVYLAFNRPSWSISDEMFFYLIFPFLVVFLAKKIKGSKQWLYIFLFLFGLFPILMLVTPSAFQ